MSMRGLLLVLALLLLVGSGVLLLRAYVLSQIQPPAAPEAVAPPPPPPANMVLVAAAPIPTGTFLKDELLRWQAWPSQTLDPNYMLQGKVDIKSLDVAVALHDLAAGEPVVEGKIARPGDRGFLAAVLKPGMRAMAIGVTDITGVAGLVYPGDRVDILLTHDVPTTSGKIITNAKAAAAAAAPGASASSDTSQAKPAAGTAANTTPDARAGVVYDPRQAHRVTETLLMNVRILAIDQLLTHPGQPQGTRTTTIEVTPKESELLTVAQDLGRLSITLRGLAKGPGESNTITDIRDVPEPDPGTSYTFDTEVSHVPLPTSVRPVARAGGYYVPQNKIEVNRGGKVEQLLVN
jgi:pilus assembly protein CpaB